MSFVIFLMLPSGACSSGWGSFSPLLPVAVHHSAVRGLVIVSARVSLRALSLLPYSMRDKWINSKCDIVLSY